MKIMDYGTRDVVTVTPSDSIDKAISLMEERNLHHLVVATEKDHVVGMLSDRDVLISTGWMLSIERCVRGGDGAKPEVVGPTQVRQIMSQPVACLTDARTPQDAALLMLHHKIGAAPLLNQDRLVGVITETDLVKWPPLNEAKADQILNGKVADLMRAQVLTVVPDAPLAEVVHLLRSRRIRHVPVTLQGKLVGMISDRDVRRALGWSSMRDQLAEAEGRLLEVNLPQTAGDIMHSDVRMVELATSLRTALREMLNHRIHSLPVVEEGQLRGIVTQTDFLRTFAGQALR